MLPLPVARLLRRARNAKSSKDRHDTAYRAWEVSVRLTVATAPPEDLGIRRPGQLSSWISGLDSLGQGILSSPLQACLRLFRQEAGPPASEPEAVTRRNLLDALAAYGERIVGPAARMASPAYDQAAEALRVGLSAAWGAGIFLEPQGQLFFLGGIDDSSGDTRAASLVELMGEEGQLAEPGESSLKPGLEPCRLYWKEGREWKGLWPWILFDPESEKVSFLVRYREAPEYLDFESGEVLSQEALERLAPGAVAYLEATFRDAPESGEVESTTLAESFGEFRILGKLGEGGMGEVYLAEQTTLRRAVSLKLLPKRLANDPVSVARFQREILALSRCEHPNVVKILASGFRQGVPFYAMEYVEGADLDHVARALSKTGDFSSAVSTACEAALEERKALFEGVPEVRAQPVIATRDSDRYREVARFFRDAALGVDHLHQHGILHRDLKPANIMITANDHRAVVMDLGLAAMENASVSLTADKGQVLGTLRYMPPEQLQRSLLKLDRRSDVYSLGATLYELITDRPFLTGDSAPRLFQQVLHESPVPIEQVNPSAPRDLATIVRKATEKDIAQRYDSAAALASDLEAFLESRPISARSPSLGYVFRKAVQRHRGLSAVVAVSVLILVAGTVIAFRQVTSARNDAQLAAKSEEQQRVVAESNETLARSKAQEAEAEKQRAERNLEELLQLSSIEILNDLRRRADQELWPLSASSLSEIRSWIEEAERLRNELLEPLQSQLRALELQALPWTEAQARSDRLQHPLRGELEAAEEELATLEERLRTVQQSVSGPGALLSGRGAQKSDRESVDLLKSAIVQQQSCVSQLAATLSERRTFEFRGDSEMTAGEKRWRHRLLRSLVDDLEDFFSDGIAEPEPPMMLADAWSSKLSAVSLRQDLILRQVQETLDGAGARERWAAAARDIRQHSEYGFEMPPQEGLLPIGTDPDSGLWEFAVPATGTIPERDREGRLQLDGDSALVLVLIPGGEFDMGAWRVSEEHREGMPNVDPWSRGDESPVRHVFLDPFFLSKNEVTQGQWERCRGDRPSHYGLTNRAGPDWRQHPVEDVSWLECQELCSRLQLILPTEAQWEYATRARTTTIWWPGNSKSDLQGTGNFHDQSSAKEGADAWGKPVPWDDGHYVHAPVGLFRANRFGLHDVHSNVWEWCRDGFRVDAYDHPARPGDGLGPFDEEEVRVLRGGCFFDSASFTRSAFRTNHPETFRSYYLGLRPARPVTKS